MGKTREKIAQELLDKDDRTDYAVEFGDSSIALQIKALRLKNGWTQAELGERAGMKQSRISEMEDVDYSSWSVSTLRRLAEAFDLPLVVRFEGWGAFLDDVVSFSRANLERPPIEEDPAFNPLPPPSEDSPAASDLDDATPLDRPRNWSTPSTAA